MSTENGKVCCNCRHNIRTPRENRFCETTCEIDGHYIGYVDCMEHWCRRWASDEKYWKERRSDDK